MLLFSYNCYSYCFKNAAKMVQDTPMCVGGGEVVVDIIKTNHLWCKNPVFN